MRSQNSEGCGEERVVDGFLYYLLATGVGDIKIMCSAHIGGITLIILVLPIPLLIFHFPLGGEKGGKGRWGKKGGWCNPHVNRGARSTRGPRHGKVLPKQALLCDSPDHFEKLHSATTRGYGEGYGEGYGKSYYDSENVQLCRGPFLVSVSLIYLTRSDGQADSNLPPAHESLQRSKTMQLVPGYLPLKLKISISPLAVTYLNSHWALLLLLMPTP